MDPRDFPVSPALALERLDAPVRREDLDGDNWPVTWADDDALYAAYGDGWGCRPLRPETKRNTGLVRLREGPTECTGEEVDCPWFGAGAEDPNLKGCGLLAVDGVLYHFLRYQVRNPAGGPRLQVGSRLICGGAARLAKFADALMQRQTDALVVTEGDQSRIARYARGWGPERPHGTASLAKTLVGAMGLLVAGADGRLAVEDPASRYVPAWAGDALRAGITVGQLATHTSGLEDAEEAGLPHDQLPGWKGRFWRRDPDPFTIARDEARMVTAPGTQFQYSNPGNAMLGYCITASLRGSPTADLRALLRDRLLRPIGVDDSEWSIGYGAPTVLDGLALYATWGGGAFTAPATVAVGRFLLQGGCWGGETVVDPAWVRRFLTEAGNPRPQRVGGKPEPANGLALWLNVDLTWPELPRDAILGAGAGHQLLLVIPSLDLVVVRYGARLAPGGDYWPSVDEHVLAPLGAAIG